RAGFGPQVNCPGPLRNHTILLLAGRGGKPPCSYLTLSRLAKCVHSRQNLTMPARQCHHCKKWIEPNEEHDCWTTTEAALTRDLPDDLREAWERIRETAAAFGDQRIYASGRAIMFSRKSCYFFVRPKKNFLEVCVFLSRAIKAPQVRRVDSVSKSKLFHI